MKKTEENLSKTENEDKKVISGEEFEYAQKQWFYKSIIWVVVCAIAVAIITAAVTYYVTYGKSYSEFYNSTANAIDDEEITSASDAISDITSLLTIFANKVDSNYIGEINKSELINSTLKGFIEGLGDEYSEYMTAEEWEEYQESALGNYVGVGIYMTTDDNGNVIVSSTISGTPAGNTDIQSEDIIAAVDGESTSGMTSTDVANAIKGEAGTEVTVTMYRNGEYIDYTLTREEIKIYHVESEMLSDDTGYIELITFDEGCAEEFETAMDELIDEGATKIIFDLRYNTGGLVDEALSIIDLFVDKGTTTLIQLESDGTEIVTTSETDKKYDVEMVILVNDYTASASEIVTGALMDNGVAVSVGTTTYGKGVIQNVYSLSDGGVLKLTTAEYYTPNRNKINKVGITPD